MPTQNFSSYEIAKWKTPNNDFQCIGTKRKVKPKLIWNLKRDNIAKETQKLKEIQHNFFAFSTFFIDLKWFSAEYIYFIQWLITNRTRKNYRQRNLWHRLMSRDNRKVKFTNEIILGNKIAFEFDVILEKPCRSLIIKNYLDYSTLFRCKSFVFENLFFSLLSKRKNNADVMFMHAILHCACCKI